MGVDDNAATPSPVGEQSGPSGLKLLLDIGPLLIFFGVYAYAGIFAATATFIPVTLAALFAGRYAFGKFGIMPLVTAGFVLVMGGLTLALHDETFIKVKPTLVYLLFAGVALVGLAFNWIVWKQLFGEVFTLTDVGWRKLQFRWGGFFLGMAMLNELMWRLFSTDAWVAFKVFGALPLTFVFALLQIPLLSRHAPAAPSVRSNAVSSNAQDGTS